MVKILPLKDTRIMALVYLDASSAILLFRAGLFEQTARIFSLVLAHEVFREINQDGYPGAGHFRDMAASGKIKVLEPKPHFTFPRGMTGFSALDTGEQETIARYLGSESPAGSFILMDDGQGARFCCHHHIPFINALLVPKIFWYSGLMKETQAKEKMQLLTGLGRYSRRIISKAGKLSCEDLADFIVKKA